LREEKSSPMSRHTPILKYKFKIEEKEAERVSDKNKMRVSDQPLTSLEADDGRYYRAYR
jgi:hypothetical protein